jgi:hypothetical protein
MGVICGWALVSHWGYRANQWDKRRAVVLVDMFLLLSVLSFLYRLYSFCQSRLWILLSFFVGIFLANCELKQEHIYSMWTPLWSSGQSSWLQIQRSGFNSRRYEIFWEVVSLERGPLSLVSAIDRLCGLVARAPGYRSRDSGSIPGTTRLSEK